jgi:cell division protein FtsB
MEMNTRVEEINGEILALKQLLAMSDYKAIKHSEGLISDAEYAPTKAEREDLRTKINDLEAELAALDE